MRLNSLAHVGGVNSIENFARSWQRAAGFAEIPSRQPSFVFGDEEGEPSGARISDEEGSPGEYRSLLRQQLERESAPESVFEDNASSARIEDDSSDLEGSAKPARVRGSPITGHAPYLASPFAAKYDGIYGSLSSRVNASSLRHADRLFHEQQAVGVQEPDKEHEPLLIKRVEREDGKLVQVVIGQSTLPQTVFNSVNVLIGVGLLSLPLGFRYSGWIVGMAFFLLSALATRYTAWVLAKCLDVDQSLITFADIAYTAFGAKARVLTSVIFFFELIAACVALLVLFADSLDALIPGWGVVEFKILGGIILVPLSFVPLRFLSFTSVLGIVSCIGIVILILVDGFLKPHSPGSLREPAETFLFPNRWSTLPLSFGLLMAPWGGHSVFPNIYRDMRHPRKYPKGLNITYGFTYLLELSMAVAGLLMFGEKVRDELTSNILRTNGYPGALSICIVIFIAIIPLTKIPLNVRPIVVTTELLLGLSSQNVPSSSSLVGLSGSTRGIFKFSIRVMTIVVILLIAIFVPSFDTIMAFSGSALTFTICIVLPLAFYLKIFGHEIGWMERVMAWFLMGVSVVIALVGTVWVFLPKQLVGAI